MVVRVFVVEATVCGWCRGGYGGFVVCVLVCGSCRRVWGVWVVYGGCLVGVGGCVAVCI